VIGLVGDRGSVFRRACGLEIAGQGMTKESGVGWRISRFACAGPGCWSFLRWSDHLMDPVDSGSWKHGSFLSTER